MSRESFLNAIRDNPDDDNLRLIFADWLEENGEADHGALMRVQCRLERSWELSYRERQRLLERETDLLTAHRRDWFPDLPGSIGVRFHRGLMHLRCRLDDLTHAKREEFHEGLRALLSEGWVEALHLKIEAPERAGVLAELPLNQIVKLNVRGSAFDENGLQFLTQAPSLNELRELELNSSRPGQDGLAHLFHSPFLGRLRALTLSGHTLTIALSALLSAADNLQRLERLYLREVTFTEHGFHAFTEHLGLPKLRGLELRACRLNDELLARLTECSSLAGLEHLDLSSNGLTARGMRSLADSRFSSLTTLCLNGVDCEDEGVRALATSSILQSLRELALCSCDLRDESANALAWSPYLEHLRRLRLRSNAIDKEGLRILLRKFGSQLEVLDFTNNAFATNRLDRDAPGFWRAYLGVDDLRMLWHEGGRETLRAALGHDDPGVHQHAFDAAHQLLYAQVLQLGDLTGAWLEVLARESWHRRHGVQQARRPPLNDEAFRFGRSRLRETSDPKIVEYLRGALRDAAPEIRGGAAKLAGWMPEVPADIRATLENLQCDAHGGVALTAREALVKS